MVKSRFIVIFMGVDLHGRFYFLSEMARADGNSHGPQFDHHM